MSNQKKKGKKKKWLIGILVVLLLLAAAAAAVLFLLQKNENEKNPLEGLKTESAVTGTISVNTEGSGSVEAASTKAITLDYDGKLEEIFVERGDQVRKGDVLAVYDMDALDSVIDAKEAELEQINSKIASADDSGSEIIKAPVTGRVKRIFAAVDDDVTKVVEQNGGLAEISADGKLKVEFTCSAQNLSVGDSVTVDFESYSVTGTVEKVEGEKVCVTIPDNTDYMVDTEATIYGKSGTKIGSGKLLSNHPYLVRASYGIIKEVSVSKTSKVEAGNTMFRRKDYTYNQDYLDLLTDREELIEDLRELKDYQKNPVVTCESDGYIVTLDVMEGMLCEKDQQFCTIADESSLNLKIEIDELDIDGVKVGQDASVVFDAFEDEVYEGKVEKISGIGNNAGGVTTYTVTISLAGDAHLKNAMSATAKIEMEKHDNVVLVPSDAIQIISDIRYVEVVSGDQTELREVRTGLVNEEYAEILEGINAGEQVVVTQRNSEDIFERMMRRTSEMRRG